MSKKTIRIKVNYELESEFEVPDNVLKQLDEANTKMDEFNPLDHPNKYPEASEWLLGNIKEIDCMELTYEIESIE